MTGIGRWKANGLQAWDGHTVEPAALGDLNRDEVVLLRFVEILDPVRVATQLVLHLEARHPDVAVEVEDAETPGRIPATAPLS